MAATKRKRRGGLAVQAKKLKRDTKDGKLPAKPNDVSEEAAEEEKDRIPGPVCKVKGALRPRLHALFVVVPTWLPLCGFQNCRGCYGSSVSARPGGPAAAFASNPSACGCTLGRLLTEQLHRFQSCYLARREATFGTVTVFGLITFVFCCCWRKEFFLKIVCLPRVYIPSSDGISRIFPYSESWSWLYDSLKSYCPLRLP